MRPGAAPVDGVAGLRTRAGPGDPSPSADGGQLFARFAFAPNELGYCGPPESGTVFDLAVHGRSGQDPATLARGFSGAWPYLALLAELAGIADPLDERVVRAYWTGGPLLDRIDPAVFGPRLIEYVGTRAGHYWRHLAPALVPEASPTHGFHVFGVYPWSRLLAAPSPQPLAVLDNCRIRWGQVLRVDGEQVVVRSRRLTWDGRQLGLAAPDVERVRFSVGGQGLVQVPQTGEWLALHWDWVCDRLATAELSELSWRTGRQLRVTNARLAGERKDAA